jgi:citronellol/citronellal dehydrogenase
MGQSRVFASDLLAGQVALVTGGGTGLGKAAATELAACGARVVIAGRRAEKLDAVADELGADVCSTVVGDIRKVEDAERIVETPLERHGRLDFVLNNAGGQYFVPAEAIEAKGWRAVWALNVEATLRMTRLAAERALIPGGGGMIVNTSHSPHHGLPGMTHSSAARAALETASADLAAEWASSGVGVVTVAAGHFDTEALRKYPEPVRRSVATTVPLGRLGRPEEHGWLVALLASPVGRALSGSVVTLDGARDNWFGPWPPAALTADTGEVPTEERRSKPVT